MPFEPVAADDAAPRASGALVSLAFWLSLLVSGALFAAATLSGKVLATERHAVELAVQTARVERLALEVHRLELQARALEVDPDYIAAVARRKLAGEPVLFPGRRDETDATKISRISPLNSRLEPLRPRMLQIASDSLLRARLLTIAAALVLFAFTFLHERTAVASTGNGPHQ